MNEGGVIADLLGEEESQKNKGSVRVYGGADGGSGITIEK